ncbi:MAG TPA: hypothetical protein VHB99_00940 [Pirellulales bacterium]|nr:hypothetical protein [Pirellulales bacterium]
MSQSELLKAVIDELNRAGVEYMLTGSLASSLQGEPRLTHDIDLVVAMDAADADRIIEAFASPDYYLSAAAAHDAVRTRRMFNLLDLREGDKVDFWLLTDDPFDRSRFSRRGQMTSQDLNLWVSSPEDTILAKLRWAELSGGSEKQFGDALRIYEVQRQNLDTGYIGKWAEKLGLKEIWDRLQGSAEPI